MFAYVLFREFNGSRFKSLRHSEFVCVSGERLCSNFTDLHAQLTFPNTACWRDRLVSIVYFCLRGGMVASFGDQPASWSCLGAQESLININPGMVRRNSL